MQNIEIRSAAKEGKVRLWEIANFIGISEASMTRLLRTPLSDDREHQILSAIQEIKCSRGKGNV